MVELARARALWWALEPYHAVVYFAPDAKSTYEAIGLKGFWMGYFASRAAPLGPVPAEVVTAERSRSAERCRTKNIAQRGLGRCM